MTALQRAVGNRAVAAAVAAYRQVDGPAAAGTCPTRPPAAPGLPGLPPVVQRALVNGATWGAVDPTTGQGTSVDAIVGPGYVYGSGPGALTGFRPYDYTSLFSAATSPAFYCQGHLLNDNLGGPGDPAHANAAQNLTAFPQKPTNSDHNKAIEQSVKNAAKTSWFRYQVSIGYATDNADRLRRRLGAQTALATSAGIAATDRTFTYASSLTAQWTELDQSPAATNAAPPAKPGGITGSLGLAIPSPMTFLAAPKRADEYAGYVKVTWGHLTSMKGVQSGARVGTLPPGGGNPPAATRAHVVPQRWLGIDDARNGVALVSVNPAFQAGHQHYQDGVAESRAGPRTATRLGRGYSLGYEDFQSGIEQGRATPLATPPVAPPQATVDGHAEFWAGVALGETQDEATPPAGNRAHVEGHADFWAGVTHGHTHDAATAPVGLGEAKGHLDYWAGVAFAAANPPAVAPAGNLGRGRGHAHYWAGVTAARADLAGPLPAELGKLTGHTDFSDGVAHGRAQPRATAPQAQPGARRGAWVEYWQGADLARTAPPATPYAGPSAAEGAGFADYRQAAALAESDLTALHGPAPAVGGGAEGFADYRDGVQACLDGSATDAARPAYDRGWQACAEGLTAGADAAGPPPVRTDAGFRAGYVHARGMGAARAGQDAPAPAGGLEPALAAVGHGGYLAGVAAARADAASAKPARPAAGRGHADYLDGLAHARAHPRAQPPDPGSAGRTLAAAEYWQGVDHARLAPVGTAHAGLPSAAAGGYADYHAGVGHAMANAPHTPGVVSAAGAQGAGDYWSGETHARGQAAAPLGPVAAVAAHTAYEHGLAHARASTANLDGGPPAGRVAASSFDAYRTGVDRAENGHADDPTSRAFSVGWHDYRAAEADVRGGQPVAQQTWSGYLRGFARTPPPKPKRSASADVKAPAAKSTRIVSD